MTTTALVTSYISLVALTYVIYHQMSAIKSYKSDICYGQYQWHSKFRMRNVFRSLIAPISTIALLIDIWYFIFIESKENFDIGVTKIWIEEKGKEKTREYLNVYFDIIPHYLEDLLKE